MRLKVLFLLTLVGFVSLPMNAQRNVRIGYIDTEYILQNVPEYQEATTQLDNKVQKWKAEIEQRLNEVQQKKQQLESERVLLTQELYEERLEDITFEENEILDYQQKRFGPNGDMMIQKRQLIQPIQDQIFAAVQEIATNKAYDFIFDKSADVVMLYAANRFDISELVIRSISRSSKRKQAQSRAERKAAEKEDVVPEINKELEAREKALEEKRTERQKAIEARKAAQQARRDSLKAAAEARRQKIIEERAAAQNKRDSLNNKRTAETNETEVDSGKKTKAELAEEKKQQKIKEREARKKAIEERRKKILEARQKAREERDKQKESKDSIPSNENEN